MVVFSLNIDIKRCTIENMAKDTRQKKRFEIELFDKVAKNWSKSGEDPTFYYILNLLEKNGIQLQGRMLEAGCGKGVLGKQLLLKFPKLWIVGIDIAPKMVRLANDGTGRFRAIKGDLEDMNRFRKDEFDIIFCVFVLHHFPKLDMVMENFEKWLKPGGKIIILEPNGANIIESMSQRVRKFVELIMGEEFVVRRSYATPNETNHKFEYYARLLKQHRFKVDIVETTHINIKLSLRDLLTLGGAKMLLDDLINEFSPKSKYTDTLLGIVARKVI